MKVKLYKCAYCDSVFNEFHTNCPNCGGSNWLTSQDEKEDKEVTEEVAEEIPVETTDCQEESHPISDTFTVIFTLFMLGLAAYILLTSNPFVQLIHNLFGI